MTPQLPGTTTPTRADSTSSRAPAGERLAAACYSVVLAVVIVAPLLRPGYPLLRDAVATPRSYLTDAALGLGDSAPRAVPQDAVIAALSTVVDGGVVVKVATLVALWLAGWGAAVAARGLLGARLGAQLVAATVTCWNPFVAERLLQGHWSLLVGYAMLPWIAVFARQRDRIPALVGCMTVAALTPTGGVLAAGVALAARPRRPMVVAVLAVVGWLPWLVAAVLTGTAAQTADPIGVAAFAARAEPGLGTLGSLAGLGGIWNGAAVPPSRATLFALLATAVLLGLVLPGLPTLWRRTQDPANGGHRRLVVLAAAAIVLPAAAATDPGLAVGGWLSAHLPGAGLLRDAQKFVAAAVPAYALAAAATVERLTARSPRPLSRIAVPAAALALVIAVLPDLALGVGGRLRPVRYPASWQHAVAAVRQTPDGAVAVLPAGMFRRFPYAGDAPVLDPAPRFLPREVPQSGTLTVGRPDAGVLRVTGEGARARTVEAALLHGDSPARLARLGVGAVLVERTTPGPLGASARTLARLRPVYLDAELALYRVPGPIAQTRAPHRRLAIAAHLMWAGLLVATFGRTAAAASARLVARGRRRIKTGR